MDSLLFLCARHIVAHRPLPALPAELYPILFQAAFLDGRPLVLRDLVAAWPFPVLNFQRLVGRRELLRDHPCKLCVQAVILAVVAQLRRDLEEPGRDSRWVWEFRDGRKLRSSSIRTLLVHSRFSRPDGAGSACWT